MVKTFVTSAAIEEVGEAFVLQCTEDMKQRMFCIDIEGIVTDKMHLEVEYAAFAEDDPDKIGFISDGKYKLHIYENGKKVSHLYSKGTIVLDRYLQRPENSGRRRFVLAHEAGHVLLERMSPFAQGPLFDRCRAYDGTTNYTFQDMKESDNLCEVQANQMAAVLLMPRFLIVDTIKTFHNAEPIKVYGCSQELLPADKVTVNDMADSLGVSIQAFMIRLKTLGFLEYHSAAEYAAINLIFEEKHNGTETISKGL